MDDWHETLKRYHAEAKSPLSKKVAGEELARYEKLLNGPSQPPSKQSQKSPPQ